MSVPPVVLFEDAHVLAVDKPAGLLTQGRAGGEASLEDAVRGYLADPSGRPVYLGTVHRLDRPVSGAVLWAKTPKAAHRVAEQFARREAAKEYWAVCEVLDRGIVPADGTTDEWSDALAPSTDATGTVRVVDPAEPKARTALTRCSAGQGAGLPDGLVWLRLYPLTGRTHQLRAQAGHRGLPVWGDRLYGSVRSFDPGIALHARSLTFRHPVLKREVVVTATPPDSWAGQGILLPGSSR